MSFTLAQLVALQTQVLCSQDKTDLDSAKESTALRFLKNVIKVLA
jgi:hypothetical protein